MTMSTKWFKPNLLILIPHHTALTFNLQAACPHCLIPSRRRDGSSKSPCPRASTYSLEVAQVEIFSCIMCNQCTVPLLPDFEANDQMTLNDAARSSQWNRRALGEHLACRRDLLSSSESKNIQLNQETCPPN
ncbi:hypothetical protein M413DRAFT_384092 [Hebeloma cylindrosporum]|uniref:Uncharacterized protein n=1 Tax=Hebeloma cylindrosporum TaxID=76867 RepID=A0A0C2YRB5_HEBCY|nr:hypothetical protein M413DRAFT_384092 [Hebeloma cylindrosporum h7]